VTDVSVIIVSYNTARLLADCLASLLASKGAALEVFVVDNASRDESVALVRERFPMVRLIVNAENRGFGAANNQALRECSGRYVVLLNPDTTVEPSSLRTLVAFMEAHPEVGLAGPRVLNMDGTRQDSVSYRYPGERYGAANLGKLPGEIACVMGACQIIGADFFRSVGGFDEEFFLYGEDQDLCLRIRQRGKQIAVVTDATIRHHGGQSERDTLPEEVVRKKIRAEYLFYRKHYRTETIERIRRRQRTRARWRMFTIRLLLPLTADKKKALQKLRCYTVINEELAHGTVA
jgi:GT2 family glycosyltransferase